MSGQDGGKQGTSDADSPLVLTVSFSGNKIAVRDCDEREKVKKPPLGLSWVYLVPKSTRKLSRASVLSMPGSIVPLAIFL